MRKYGGKLVFETADIFGPVEVIEDEKGRHLHFGTSSRQSSLLFDRPFGLVPKLSFVMMLSLLFHPKPKSALILGMGAGGMAKFLWKHFPGCHVDAVELSPGVVQAAYDYFQLPKDERLAVHTEDAMAFLEKEKKQYDLIFVDLFLSDKMSDLVTTEQFFGHCHARLKPGGVLSWNTWKNTEETILVASLEALCLFFMDRLVILPVQEEEKHDFEGKEFVDSGNNIFLVFKEPVPKITPQQIQKNAQELMEKTGEDFPALYEAYNRFKGFGKLSFCK